MKKKILSILIITMLFMFGGKVNAEQDFIITHELPDKIGTISQLWDLPGYYCEGDVTDSQDTCHEKHRYGIAIQVSNIGTMFCTDYDLSWPAGIATSSTACKKQSGWSISTNYAIARIIQSSEIDKNITGSRNPNTLWRYLATDLAINEYLKSTHYGGKDIAETEGESSGDKYQRYIQTSTIKTRFENLYSIAVNSKSEFENFAKFNLGNISEFVPDGNNYVATVSIEKVDKNITNITPSVTVDGKSGVATVTSNSGNTQLTITVPKDKVKQGTVIELIVEASHTNIPQARKYFCGEDLQGLTAVDLEYGTMTNVEKKTATIDIPDITIKKLDKETKEVVKDAELQLLNSDKRAMTNCKINGATDSDCKWKTTNNNTIINDLRAGTYYIKEVSAPNGYKLSNDLTQIIVKETGNETFVVYNEKTKVDISKQIAVGSGEIPGATLVLTNSKDQDFKCTIKQDGQEKTLDKCSWVSGNTPVTIIGLTKGKYILAETISPAGYEKNTTKVNFELKEDGTVTVDGKTVDKVEMKNDYTKLKITKINSVDGKPLKGAKLKLLDKDKKEIEKCIYVAEDGTKKLSKKCEWTSTEKAMTILKLAPGTYYLQELEAPEGYVLNDKLVMITIDENGTSQEVKMVNDLEVKVPDTLSARSTLLLAVAMFDIALGIGILTYVKKNKIEE